jgi:protocatechuate 3,4-dioxygenase alpha subunit
MPDGAPQAPHIVVTLFARGLLNHVVTRLYFADEAANTHDPILALVPAHRRDTLLARPSQVDGHTVYHFDVVLQGEHETAFFAV